jgi:hypothetical protein
MEPFTTAHAYRTLYPHPSYITLPPLPMEHLSPDSRGHLTPRGTPHPTPHMEHPSPLITHHRKNTFQPLPSHKPKCTRAYIMLGLKQVFDEAIKSVVFPDKDKNKGGGKGKCAIL